MTHLILGGTTEARLLAERLAARPDLAVTLSLAGRTANPVAQPVPVRSGGFGGPQGLADYLVAERIDALIDATHPYAAIMSANAAQAASSSGVPLLALRRPPWVAVAGDRWIEADDAAAAVRALGEVPRRVFLALGRNDIAIRGGTAASLFVQRRPGRASIARARRQLCDRARSVHPS